MATSRNAAHMPHILLAYVLARQLLPALRSDVTSSAACNRDSAATSSAAAPSHRSCSSARVAGAASLYLRASSSSSHLKGRMLCICNVCNAGAIPLVHVICCLVQFQTSRRLVHMLCTKLCRTNSKLKTVLKTQGPCCTYANRQRSYCKNAWAVRLQCLATLADMQTYIFRFEKPMRLPNCSSSKPPATSFRK